MSWWDEYVVPTIARPEVPATLGAILGWLGAPGTTVRQQAFNFLAGIGSAIYVAPYLAETLGITSQAGTAFFVFVMGMLGMNLLAKTIDHAKGWSIFGLIDALQNLRKPPERDQ